MKVRGTVWVVTGAGSGMGRETTLELLRRGADVAAVDIRAEGLAGTAERAAAFAAGRRLTTHVASITDAAAVAALVDEVEAAHGHVDGLLNNAGIIQPFVPVVDMTDADIARVLDVNFNGTLLMVRAFLPRLLQRPTAHLANVSSMGGFFPFPGQTIYGASKAAVKLLTEGLYAELLDTPVRVSVILPGAVATSITENSGVAPPPGADAGGGGMPTTAADVAARIIVDGIERDALHIYVGRDARLMSLAIRVAPRRAIVAVQKKMRALMAPQETPTP